MRAGAMLDVVLAAALFLTAPAVHAEATPPEAAQICFAAPPAQTHDGFYARIHAGAGYLAAHNGPLEVTGAQVALGVAVGAVVLPNLALFADLVFHVAIDPTIRNNGMTMAVSGSSFENDSFGAGATYYLEPLNLYGSASINGSSVQLYNRYDSQLAGSRTGLGFQVMVGKEWWAGREWGLGVAGELSAAWMTDDAAAGLRWRALTYSLVFSATYN